ncbi:MAG: hypothetical protein H6559_29885 [Lewinellaceae bacterium]|nr:hypothetical protein [Lewinellaceae bacterium]
MQLIDGSKIITEACVRAGADVYVGYPITPSNWFYAYAQKRFPLFLAGPDEISVLQWMAGFSAAGRLPVTATSFPGLALMVESLNMAHMMELPMLIIVTQRLGPSTGSATTGAQGDLLLLRGAISGGYQIPVFCPSSFEDCWNLAYEAVKTAVNYRTPVVLLTSKEMVMTYRSFDLSGLPEIKKVENAEPEVALPYQSYRAGADGVPPFIPLGDESYQVRLNASTHGRAGLIQKESPEAMANTRRLQDKLEGNISEFTFFELDEEDGAGQLIVSYGISADAARDALAGLRRQGKKVSLLIIKTLLPVPPAILSILERYEKQVFVEENLPGLLRELIYGQARRAHIRSVNKIGSMIAPSEIIKEFAV